MSHSEDGNNVGSHPDIMPGSQSRSLCTGKGKRDKSMRNGSV